MNRVVRTRLARSACNAVLLLLTAPAAGQAGDLLITEYTCLNQAPTPNSRFLELTNLTPNPIYIENSAGHPGANGPYFLTVNFNAASGNGTAIMFQELPVLGRLPPIGYDPDTLAEIPLMPGQSYVIAQFNGGLQGHATATNLVINGDDAVLLRRGSVFGPIVDSFGQVGVDPGSEWGTGYTSSYTCTLRRKATVCQGDVNTNNTFDPSAEWIGIHWDEWIGYGLHAGCASGAFNVSPVAINDRYSTNEDSPTNIPYYLNDSDVDSTILPQWILVAPPQHGVLTYPGGLTSNQQAPPVLYTPDLDFSGDDSIVYQITDEFGAISNPATVTLQVVAVNDSPMLDTSGMPSLPPIYVNETTNIGMAVVDLCGDRISDPDSGALQGIAVVGVENTYGSWQYSVRDVNTNATTDGGDFVPFGVPSENSSRLLAADEDNRVRFVPNAGFDLTATFTFRAWDRTNGADGGTSTTTNVGGSTPFSAALGIATQSIFYRIGDINGDGPVDATDVAAFVNVLLGLNINPEQVRRSDLDHNGTANGKDIAPFLNAYL